jgi:hypothetical protein
MPIILQRVLNCIPERNIIWRLCQITLISLKSARKSRFWQNRVVRYLKVGLFKHKFLLKLNLHTRK